MNPIVINKPAAYIWKYFPLIQTLSILTIGPPIFERFFCERRKFTRLRPGPHRVEARAFDQPLQRLKPTTYTNAPTPGPFTIRDKGKSFEREFFPPHR